MSRAILFNIPASGHVNPTIPIMELLRESNLEVVYVNTEDQRERIESLGVRFVAYPGDYSLEKFFDNATTDNFARNSVLLLTICNEVLPFCLELVEQEQADFIIHDTLASWGLMTARIAKLPSIGFVSTFLLDNSALLETLSVGDRVKLITQLLRSMPAGIRQVLKLRRTYEAKPVLMPDALMALSEQNIVFTAREFQPSQEKFPDQQYHFVGSPVARTKKAPQPPYPEMNTDKKKVYISLGTINRNEQFLHRCLQAFGDMEGLQVILSIGKQTDIGVLGTIPDNFIVKNFVPQLDVLDHVDAFITHCGLNSIHESLLAGVPLVAIPQQFEQVMNAVQVVNVGAGVGLQLHAPFGDVTPDELRQALQTVLDNPHYKQNAVAMGDKLREAGGAQKVVEILTIYSK